MRKDLKRRAVTNTILSKHARKISKIYKQISMKYRKTSASYQAFKCIYSNDITFICSTTADHFLTVI